VFEPIESQRLYSVVVDHITESILSGEMQPGDRLPIESELADQFNVSRTVIREAIKTLSAQGLVQVAPRRGTIITEPPIDTIIQNIQLRLKLEDASFDDLLFSRRLLEVPIARLAAENANSHNLKVLEKHLLGMQDNLNDIDLFIFHDTAFHVEMARATQNLVLTLLIQIIVDLLGESRQIAVRVRGVTKRALEYHQKIFKAIQMKDSEEAAKLMDEHILQVTDDTNRARKRGLIND
jgi:GntR family transcriptional repressor for pyruvate dehydrogenase complex